MAEKTVLWGFLKEFALSNSFCTLFTFSHKSKQPFPSWMIFIFLIQCLSMVTVWESLLSAHHYCFLESRAFGQPPQKAQFDSNTQTKVRRQQRRLSKFRGRQWRQQERICCMIIALLWRVCIGDREPFFECARVVTVQ